MLHQIVCNITHLPVDEVSAILSIYRMNVKMDVQPVRTNALSGPAHVRRDNLSGQILSAVFGRLISTNALIQRFIKLAIFLFHFRQCVFLLFLADFKLQLL